MSPSLVGSHDNHAVGRGSVERELSTERHDPVSGRAADRPGHPVLPGVAGDIDGAVLHRGDDALPIAARRSPIRTVVRSRLTPGIGRLVTGVQCRAEVGRHVHATLILDRHDAIAAGAHVTGDPGRCRSRCHRQSSCCRRQQRCGGCPRRPLRRPVRPRLRWTTPSARLSGPGARSPVRCGRHVSSHAGRQHGLARILGNLPVIRACARHADRLASQNLVRGGEGDDHGAGCRRSHRVRGVRQSLLCKPCDRYRSRAQVQAAGRRGRRWRGGAGAGAGGGAGAGASTLPPPPPPQAVSQRAATVHQAMFRPRDE